MPIAPDCRPWLPRGLRLFDPAARAERKRRRARRSVGVRLLATVGLAYVTSRVGVVSEVELGEVFWGTATALAGWGTVGATKQVWRLERTSRPVALQAAPVPPPRLSAARAPVTRLNSRETALAELLTVLGPLAGDTWQEAAAGASALRRLADQLVVLESARAGVPPEALPGLDAALAVLRSRLEEGVSAYDRLVSAATEAAAAQAGGRHGDGMSDSLSDAVSMRRLAEATDSLTGLARGLREVAVLSRLG